MRLRVTATKAYLEAAGDGSMDHAWSLIYDRTQNWLSGYSIDRDEISIDVIEWDGEPEVAP